MPITRTDVHRPSALDPADYTEVGWIDAHFMCGGQWIDPKYRDKDWADHKSHSCCDHCGHRLRYSIVFHHAPSDNLVKVGLTCAGTLDLSSRYEKEMKEHAERRKLDRIRAHRLFGDPRAQRAVYWLMDSEFDECELQTVRDEYMEANYDYALTNDDEMRAYKRGLKKINDVYYTGINDWGSRFLASVRWRFEKYAELSDKQVKTIEKVRYEAAERRAKREAQRLADAELEEVRTGRIEICGTVLSTKWQDNDYGGSLKMLIMDDRRFKVWGTVPMAIEPEVGDKVALTATVKASNDDRSFGFYSRPTKASIVMSANA